MALAAVACGHMPVNLRPTGFVCSSSTVYSSTSRNFAWNPLAVTPTSGPESQYFGSATELCVRTGRVTVANHRRFLRCVEAASGDAEADGSCAEITTAKKAWSALVKRGAEIVSAAVQQWSRPTVAVMLSVLLAQSNPDMAMAAGEGEWADGWGVGARFPANPSPLLADRIRGRRGATPSPASTLPPSPGFSYGVPYAAPSPFFGGGLYAAPAYGIGLGGGSIFFLVILGFIVLQAVYGFVSERSGLDGSLLSGAQKVSVVKLQVGLLGMGRTLQRDLDRIAGQADTTTAEGLHYVLTETCLALMRHPDYCISGLTSHDISRSVSTAEEKFNNFSLEERGKFDEETLVNVNNLRKRMMGTPKSERFNNEYIVVTVLVAAEGEYKLPTINGNADLKAALRKLGSIPADSIQAVEVLWTPQDENDTLSERELLRDYPLLRSL